MSKCRFPVLFVCLLAALGFASAASAQDCNNVCDPYFSSCSQYCQRCPVWTFDVCNQWVDSTCGAEFGPCIPDTCEPLWLESSRETQGSYEGRYATSCTHHVVQWVTLSDSNQCNRVSAYQTYSYCDDEIDDWKNGGFYPSCCEGYGDNGTLLTCDGNHNCTG